MNGSKTLLSKRKPVNNSFKQDQLLWELRQENERLKYIINNARDTIFQTDLKGNYTFTNSAGEKLTGYKNTEILKKDFFEIVAPEYAKPLKQRLRDRIAGKKLTQPFTLEILHKTGRRVPVELMTSGVFNDGKLVGVQCVVRELTERIKTQQTLRLTEDRLRAILNSLHETILVLFDPHGKVVESYCPPAQSKKNRLKNRKIIGKTPDQYLPKHGKDQLAHILKVAQTGKPDRKLYKVDLPGGKFWHEITWSPVQNSDGMVTGVIAFIRDITERKFAESQLEIVHKKLVSARETERRQLAADLHDSFGQGLIALEYAIENALKIKSCKSLRHLFLAASKRCQSLIREIRALCHGLYPPTLESLGLFAAMKELSHDWGKKVKVSVCCLEATTMRFPQNVEIALFRIAQEAVNNAIKHGRAGTVLLSLDYTDGHLHLRVTNNGKGFNPLLAESKGLGLTNIKDRTNAIGGELEISSGSGKTIVHVDIPIERRT